MHGTPLVRFGALVVVVGIAPACEKRREEASAHAVQTAGSRTAGTPEVSLPRTLDEAIKVAYDALSDEYYVTAIRIDYVRPDGSLDPSHGELRLETAKRRPPPPADDPSRPIGAPVPDRATEDMAAMMMERCPILTWKGDELHAGDGSCSLFAMPLERPRCTIGAVLASAAAAGAPRNALARIELNGHAVAYTGKKFVLSIDDDPRDIHFQHEVEDTCEPILEKPEP